MDSDATVTDQWDIVTSAVASTPLSSQHGDGTVAGRAGVAGKNPMGQAGTCPVQERQRLDALVAEFDDGTGTSVLVPLTQRELARRWGITPSSVQSYLCTQQRRGRVVSRAPLRLSRDQSAGGPHLRLVSEPPPQGGIDSVDTVVTVESSQSVLGELLVDALATAASAGNGEVVAHLKNALKCLLGVPTGAHEPRSADPSRAKRGSSRAKRGSSEEEPEQNFNSSSISGEGSAQGAGRAAAPDLDGLPEQVAMVVKKRLRGRSQHPESDATPSWDRPGWLPDRRWTNDDRRQAGRVWAAQRFQQSLSRDAATVLELWPAPVAAKAIELLGQRQDTRNPSGRLLDAAIWGYHAFFPPGPDLGYKEPSLERTVEALNQFRDNELVEHLQGYVRDPQRLRTKASAAIALGRLRVEDLSPLRLEPAELDTIDLAAQELQTKLATSPNGDQP